MRIPDFKLERYFARWEFNAPYLLCSSDLEGWRMADLLSRVVVFGGPERALRAHASERALDGSELTVDLAEEAATIAATETLVDDPRPDAAYRRRLTQTMVARALRDALERRTSI